MVLFWGFCPCWVVLYGQIKVVQGKKCHLGSVPRGWCFTAAPASHRDVMRNLVGGWGMRWGGEQPLKVPLPWRRSWAKQDFHQSTNRRWGGCLAPSLLRAQQPLSDCWDVLLWAVSVGNAYQHLVVMSDVEHKSFLAGLVVLLLSALLPRK